MKGIIYKYTNQINNKVYIGQTINEYKRIYAHKHTLNSWRSYFHNAIKKYGYDKFVYEILEEIDDADVKELKIKLDTLEQKYISVYKSNDPDFGYNLTLGGGGTLGLKQSKESNLKRSRTHKAKCKTLTKEQVIFLQSCNKHDYLAHHTCVCKFTRDGEFLERFDTLKDAAKSVNGNYNSLSRAIKRDGVFKGYIWKLEEQC